jgi:hypothetical protein
MRCGAVRCGAGEQGRVEDWFAAQSPQNSREVRYRGLPLILGCLLLLQCLQPHAVLHSHAYPDLGRSLLLCSGHICQEEYLQVRFCKPNEHIPGQELTSLLVHAYFLI